MYLRSLYILYHWYFDGCTIQTHLFCVAPLPITLLIFVYSMYIFFSDEEDEDECKGCDKEQEECVCKDILDNFHTINRQL